jgi:hypothetical protein
MVAFIDAHRDDYGSSRSAGNCRSPRRRITSTRHGKPNGRKKLDFQFVMTFAAYNLIRMRNLGVVAC